MTPTGIALIVCDDIYREASGKTALVGLFEQISATQFPCTHPKMCVYVSVTGCRRKTRFRLEIVHSETEERIVGMQGPPPEKAGVTSVVDLQFILAGITFKSPGRHYIRFWGDDSLLLQRPFEVQLFQAASEEQ